MIFERVAVDIYTLKLLVKIQVHLTLGGKLDICGRDDLFLLFI